MNRAKMFRNVSVIIGQPAYYEISYKVYNERLARIVNLINEFFLKELMNNEEERYFSTYISPIIIRDKNFDIKGAVFFIPLLGEYHTDFLKK